MDSRALGETEILERLTNVKSALEKEDFERAVAVLTAMRAWTTQLTTALLLSTQLGKTMNGWRKHANAGVATVAGELVSQWKDLVRESAGKTIGPSPAAKAVIEQRKASVAAGAAAAVSAAAKPATTAGGGAGAAAAGGAGSSGTGSAAGLAADLAAPLPALTPASLVDLYAASATASGYAAGPPVCHRDRIRVLRKGSGSGSGSSKKTGAAAGGAGAAESSGSPGSVGGPVVYWMSRDQRVLDNWALLRAQELALARGVPLIVVFCLLPTYADAPLRAYGFMLRGLRMVEADLAALGIPFRLLLGEPRTQIAGYANALHASAVVADFCPLRVPMAWKKDVAAALHAGCTLEEVDAHNIVPCWEASPKLEVGARTIRKKIHTAVGTYCKEIPAPVAHPHALSAAAEEGLRTYEGSSSSSSSSGTSSSSSGGAGAGAGARDAAEPGAEDVCLAPRVAAAASNSSSGEGASSSDASASVLAPTAWATVLSHLRMDTAVGELAWAKPGERAAAEVLTVSRSCCCSSSWIPSQAPPRRQTFSTFITLH